MSKKRKCNGYWNDFNNVTNELKSISVDDRMPSMKEIKSKIGSYFIGLISKFGGFSEMARKTGLKYEKRINRRDISGIKFGNLTAVKRIEGSLWECICVCGELHQVFLGRLTSGNTKSCGCKKYTAGSESRNWGGHGEISKNFWRSILYNAKIRKIDVSTNIEDAWKLFLSQDRKCAITGEKLFFSKRYSDRKKFTNASLDRINSLLPYSKENIQWVLKDVNIMKYKFSKDYFVYLCNLINKYDSNIIEATTLEISVPKEGKTNNVLWSGYGCIGKSTLTLVEVSAKKKGINCNLNVKEIWDLYIKQNGRCAFSGIPIYFRRINTNRQKRTASLDRVDSDKDYTIDNVVWVHKDINFMKNKFNIDSFKRICKLVADHNKCNDYNMMEPCKEWYESFDRVEMTNVKKQ